MAASRCASARRRVRARRVVLAAGPWLPTLLRRCRRCRSPSSGSCSTGIRPAATTGSRAARFPVFLLEAPDGRMLYGLPDQGHGLKLAEHHGGVVVRPDSVDRQVSADERRQFHAFASRMDLGACRRRPAAAAVCLYTNTPDGDFVLDWHPEVPGVYLCSACSGHGFKFAPVIGEIVAAAVSGEETGFDLTPFSVGRLRRLKADG